MAETSSTPGPLSRMVLGIGVLSAAASAVGLITLLLFYFSGADAHPVFYGFAFWGLPVAFLFLCLYMVAHAVRRRRQLRSV